MRKIYPQELVKFAHQSLIPKKSLTIEEWIDKKKCEDSFSYFIYRFWPIIEGRPCIEEWYIEVIAEHLEALYRLEISNLLINQPFRTGKSLICSILYPAWLWIKNANFRFLYTTYKEELTLRDSRRCRQVIKLPLYQKYWGDMVVLDKETNNVSRFATLAGGWRLATSVEGGNTGEGGDFSVIDDPNNIKKVESETVEHSTNNWLDRVMTTRVMKYSDHRRLVVQQRAGLRDLSAHIIRKDLNSKESSWVKLILPMEYIPSIRCTTIPLPMTNGLPWQDPRTQNGELLCPKLFSLKDLQGLKDSFNNDPLTISCQLQQNPTSELSGMIKPQWFQHWTNKYYPRFIYIIQSWDTALVGASNAAHSSCSTWGVFKNPQTNVSNIMLLSLFANQVQYPDLMKMATRLAYNYEDVYLDDPMELPVKRAPNRVVIEKKVSGYCLHDDLFRARVPVSGFNPNNYGSKKARCRSVTDLMEAGMVWLPCKSDEEGSFTWFSKDFLDAAISFPSARIGSAVNDIIDSSSQALIVLKEMGLVKNTTISPLHLN